MTISSIRSNGIYMLTPSIKGETLPSNLVGDYYASTEPLFGLQTEDIEDNSSLGCQIENLFSRLGKTVNAAKTGHRIVSTDEVLPADKTFWLFSGTQRRQLYEVSQSLRGLYDRVHLKVGRKMDELIARYRDNTPVAEKEAWRQQAITRLEKCEEPILQGLPEHIIQQRIQALREANLDDCDTIRQRIEEKALEHYASKSDLKLEQIRQIHNEYDLGRPSFVRRTGIPTRLLAYQKKRIPGRVIIDVPSLKILDVIPPQKKKN